MCLSPIYGPSSIAILLYQFQILLNAPQQYVLKYENGAFLYHLFWLDDNISSLRHLKSCEILVFSPGLKTKLPNYY